MAPLADIKAALVDHANALGFEVCRVAPAGVPPHAKGFRAWLASGMNGEMAWLEKNVERRTNPELVLPGVKSVIVLGMNYWKEAADDGEYPKSDVGHPALEPSALIQEFSTGASARNELSIAGGHLRSAPILNQRLSTSDSAADERSTINCLRPSRQGSDSQQSPEPRACGRIARYAWGDDYHEVIEPKLYELDAWLQRHGGRQRQYVDTGPVLERDFAALAGVGWHGKSTMLIHPRLGTWLFLAAILTTLELPPDEPARDHCGKCTRCIAACPTGAITAPHQVDARLCVSYLTIENKGAIPEALRPLLGDRIYGCDDCLDACPWNRFAVESRESRFAAREFVGMALREFLALDDDGFRALFRGSPIKRIKRRGFLRNVCVALGNVGTAEDLPALECAARDAEPLIAEHAQWAIGEIRRRCSPGGDL